jgi:hypothetical protein
MSDESGVGAFTGQIVILQRRHSNQEKTGEFNLRFPNCLPARKPYYSSRESPNPTSGVLFGVNTIQLYLGDKGTLLWNIFFCSWVH